jgi:DNA polymerase-3 subunit alpha
MGGVITNLQRKWTRKGDLMAVFELEDLQGSAEAMVFPRSMTEYGHVVNDDAIVVCKVRVDRRDDLPKLIVMELTAFDIETQTGGAPIHVQLPSHGLRADEYGRLKELLTQHPGDSDVIIELGQTQVRLPDEFAVDSRTGLVAELRILLGPDAVRV